MTRALNWCVIAWFRKFTCQVFPPINMSLKSVLVITYFTFWSVNFFRHTMHSKSPVANLAQRHKTLLANNWPALCKQSIVTDIYDGWVHSFVNYSLFYFITIFSKYIWLYYFIINQVIFGHFFSVGIGNELLQICYNFNYPIQSTKLILSKFLRSEM